ncbi:MAG: hypothetical protein J6W43_09590 [Prevotella sp.]|nr:hypothetical protein [Prevotella sp.]
MKNKIWYFLLAALVLSACSKDSDGGDDVRGDLLNLTAVTRTPSEAIVNAGEDHSPIQIYLMSGLQKTEGNFVYSDGWSSTIGVKEANNFIYGFSPATAAAGAISPLTGDATDYSAGAKLTLNNLETVGADDICVVVGVKNSSIPNDTPDFGVFGFNRNAGNNNVCLLLDHLYAAIDFKIRIGDKYNELRDIYLKTMELKSSISISQAVVTLTANTTGTNPMTITYTQDETTSQTNVLYDYGTDPKTTTGLKLTKEGTAFISYCAPLAGIDEKLTLVCTYDVYNKKGTRVRENCTAENSFSGIKGLTMERRKKNTVTLTVEPSYLHQLSEDELDNPTVKFN